MKKIIIGFILLFVGISSYSQTRINERDTWLLSVGVNTVANFGTQNPFEDLSENSTRFAFRQPIAIAIERQWTKFLHIEQDISFNGFKESEFIDNGTPDKDLFYFSTNTTLKYYFGSHIFKELEWLDLYGGFGLGLFNIEEINTSINGSLGMMFWVSETVAIRLQGVGKFATTSDRRQYDNNHYQFMLQAVIRI
ncbi:hypothetical protein [uncultured Psychroserpens sp.]|uniref:hypothetical protein n=1 Tax=uncultured Psychroserpens sp. TaxID=255436 RepID=UPI002631728B|nr:hypothetical protein [uncultured Psychroserpens sp.]